MLSKEEMLKFRKNLGFNIWQIEIDYLQHLFLFYLSRKTKKDYVFKDGTALKKFYGLNRFSIDLDFTSLNGNDEVVEEIANDISEFGFPAKVHKIKSIKDVGKSYTLKIQGPLYTGDEKTVAKLKIEISLRKDIILQPDLREVVPIYPDINPYIILVLKPEEILAEKIRTIFSRGRARDVYDLWFLIKKDVKIDIDLINKKLSCYKLEFSFKNLEKSINTIKDEWFNELKAITTFVPEFNQVKREIMIKFRGHD